MTAPTIMLTGMLCAVPLAGIDRAFASVTVFLTLAVAAFVAWEETR